MNSAFEVAFRDLITNEGGYVNDPKDPGGETKYGISKRSYPKVDIKNLTLDHAREIYFQDFWLDLRCDQIGNDRVAIELFDTAVNMGHSAAIKILQSALNLFGETLSLDGELGPKTMIACQCWCKKDPHALFKAMNGYQFMRYVAIVKHRVTSQRFIRGWMKRIQDYRGE